MSDWRIGPCLRCGCNFRLMPNAGNWYWACACPPPQTYTSNSTLPISPVPKWDDGIAFDPAGRPRA